MQIKKGMHGYTETATITLPSVARILKKGKASPVLTVLGQAFTDGDRVMIKLGYNGNLQEEFEGFVKRRALSLPLVIECEGYVRQLRQVSVTKNYETTSAKEVLLDMLAQTEDIDLVCPVDFPMKGINLTNADGGSIIDHIKKVSEGALAIFFIQPDVLWCGLVNTPFLAGTNVFDLPTVGYRLGWNCLQDNGLKERIPDEPVQILINGQLANGDPVRTESKDKSAKRKVTYLLNNVPDSDTLKKFANEKAIQLNYTGYQGHITGFLEPYCAPGYTAVIKDRRYPELDGTYLVESTEVTYGMDGGWRKVELGIRVA